MKKMLSMLIALAMVLSMASMAFAAEGVLVKTSASGVYDIANVTVYCDEEVTGVSVNGAEVDFTQSGEAVSFDASEVTTLGNAVVEVTTASGKAETEISLFDFVDYTGKFIHGQGAKVDFKNASTTNSKYFGFYYLSKGESDIIKPVIDTATETLKMEATNKNVTKSAYINMPEISSAIRPAATANTSTGAGDGKQRYVDAYFYADVKANETTAVLNLYDVGGFSIGVDVFASNGKMGDASYDVSYDADKWYTIKAHINSASGIFEVFAKEQNADDATYRKIYERTEEIAGPNFKRFGLKAFATSATVKYELDNLYYAGSVAQLGFESVKYIDGDSETALGSNPVPATASAFKLKANGSQVDTLSNIYIEDEDGNKVQATVTGTNSAEKTVNDIITVTPAAALTDGENYKLVIGKGTVIDNAPTAHDRVYPFSVAATEFVMASPADGAVIAQGEKIKLLCVAPGAENVTFTVGDSVISGVKAAKGSSFTAEAATEALTAGVIAVSAEATDSAGNQINYEKRYVKIVKESIVNTTAATNWVQVSGATSSGDGKNMEYVQSPYETNQQTNGRRLFYTATNTAPTAAYVFQNTTKDIGYTGKVSMSFDMMVETTTDVVNYKVYVNRTNYDLAGSTRSGYDAFDGLFNSNGKFYNTDVSYNAKQWYKMKVVFDLDAMTKALYADGKLLVEEKINDNFKCIGFSRVMVSQTKLENRTEYAAVNIDNWTVDCEGGLYETAASCDSVAIGDSRIIPETAENVTVTLNKNIESADNVKLYVNGSAVQGAAISLADGNKITATVKDVIKKGDTAEIRIGAGTSFKLATKVDAAVTSDVNAVTDADIVIPFVVGDENLLYVNLVPENTDGSAAASLVSVNEGENLPVIFIVAVYEDEESKALTAVELVKADLIGEGMIKLSENVLNGGTYAKAILLNGTTIAPVTEAKGSAIPK